MRVTLRESTMVTRTSLGRIGIVLVGAAVAAAVGVGLFALVPLYTPLGVPEVVLVALVFAAGVATAARFASNAFPAYDVAEVAVDDVITREGGSGPLPAGPVGLSADDVVEQIERADEDDAAEALVVKLNTPGGAVVPSEDIRRAAAAFDGPTVAYAEDMAASGGYWIASGCDEIHAREGTVVGSIGVNATQLGRTGLAEKVGLDYRRFVAGEYKDTPSPWRDLEADEVEYYQGIVDGFYEQFVETVAEGRDVDPEFARETEARVYLGRDALDEGLVDTVGPREEMEDRLADQLDVDEVAVQEFEPEKPITVRVGRSARASARAFGAGVASVLVGEDGPNVRV
jgi:protease-4